MADSDDDPDIDQQLQMLQEQAGDFIAQCRFASSYRLYGELRRRGRLEHRAYPYIMGTFFQMDQAQYLFDARTMRERAIELIALLEDEERLRQIQADFPVDQYEYLVCTMSPCAYENLAEATGQLEGYNSDGMHSCIADGIQICRRTGKIGCISCFREYACDVYLSADDPDIATHQCRLVMEQEGSWSDRGDRRWLATGKLAWLDALHGRFDSALSHMERALQFTDGDAVSLQFESRIRTLLLRDTIRLAAGLDQEIMSDPAWSTMPSAEECPVFAHTLDLNAALLAARQTDWNEASQLLTKWDQRLQKCQATHLWFETRLRLIAVQRRSGAAKYVDSLVKELEQRARRANDYLTLHRLQHLLDTAEPTLLALAVPARRIETITDVVSGVVVDGDTAAASESSTSETEGQEPEQFHTPLQETIDALRERMTDLMEEPTEDKFNSLRASVLSQTPETATHHEDVAGLLHLMGYLTGSGEDGEEVWRWANALAARHRTEAVVLSLLGTLGDALRNTGNESLAEKITAERTEQLFRKSLELDLTRARNFLRAGEHFSGQDNHGEAERCYARAFRLDRSDGIIVRRLADLYSNTDRPRDALHVLDVSLREGCEDSQVAFDAAMLAFRLEQYDATLTYLEKFEQLVGENLWTNYYRSVCHYEQGHYLIALECLDREEQIAESTGWHLELMRGVTKARLGDVAGAEPHIVYVMATPLYEVDFLSHTGLMELLQRLAVVAEDVLQDDTLVESVESRLLRSGLMPDSWFQGQRESQESPVVENIHLYRLLVLQPLDENWNSDPDRLSDQQDWTTYLTEWAVLAASEEQAAEIALQCQARCYHVPAVVQETLASEDSYTDVTGVVWQGARYPLGDDDEDISDDELPDEDSDDLM